MTELNIASNFLGKNWASEYADADMSGITAISDAIPTMGALATITFGNVHAVTMQASMTEADFSGKELGVSGAIIIVAAFLPKCQALEKLLMADNGIATKEAGEALGQAMASNTVLKELDVSNNARYSFNDGPAFAKGLADGIRANGALEKLLMGANDFKGAEAGKVLGDALAANTVLNELDLSGLGEHPYTKGFDVEFAKSFSVGLGANGALENLHIGNNKIPVESMNEIIALVEAKPTMKVLCAVPFRDKTITELDVSGQSLGVEGAVVIRRFLENNGALEILDISNNKIINHYGDNGKAAGKALSDALARNTVLTHLNVSDNKEYPGTSGVIFAKELADGLSTNGALASVNILNNEIDAEQAHNLATILKEHATLKSLCGNKGDETVLDMSGKNIDADGAIMLAPEIVANGALTSLNVSSNKIVSEVYIKAPREGIKVGDIIDGNSVIKEKDSDGEIKILQLDGIKALADGIKNNGALASLDLSQNEIPAEQMGPIKKLCASKQIALKE